MSSTVLPPAQAWRALAALCLGFFMILLDQTIVAVATPGIMADFDARLDQVVWVTSIYLLCLVVPLLFTGRLGDRFGQRTLFRLGITVFTLAALAAALAPTLGLLIAARAVQGVGAAILTPQTMSVINRVFPRERRGAALGVWGAVGSVATLVGPVLGGFIVTAVGWRGVFLVHLPVGVLAVVLATLWVPTLPTFARRIDAPSVLVSFLGTTAVVVAVQQGPGRGWPVWAVALGVLGVLLIALFVRLQATAAGRGTEPLVPLEMFRNRNYSLGVFSIATMGFTVSSIMLPVMLWLQDGQGLSSRDAGLMLIPMAVVAAIGSPLVGPAADRLDPRLLSVGGFGTMIVTLLLTAWLMHSGGPVWVFLVAAGLLGVGNALVWAPNSATAMRTVDIAYMGAAAGVYNTGRQTGAVLGAAGVGAAMQVGAATAGFVPGLALSLLLPVAVLGLGLVAVAFFETPPHAEPQGAEQRAGD
ncbi:MAG: DHA2 family efflux MFS transporter permease subunit [Corynebacterium humireducens]|jgi:EmrB/QacA subfamily drug resistance transporter|uniref:DHA2 family efflux MFS transporter permease subunit n=1 Tax=Corynebacterium humireducens TaxID=1223514 RepID=A0A7X6PNI5_9CORY|nr:DHA2 family efflux MFS transporter permease subunit [Corynebacterium humireducens]